MKNGLVLEGGAMRGMFTCGITDTLQKEGIAFAGMIGVSAGAAFGCNIKSNQPGRALRYNLRFCRDPRFCSWRSLIKTGDLYGAEFCYQTIPEQLDPFDFQAFNENPMDFFVVATDIDTGRPVYHRCAEAKSAMPWIRASASMPLVSRPVEIERMRLLDGGISDAIPFHFFEGLGYDRNLVILTRPRDYQKPPMQKALARAMGKTPALRRAMEERHLMYNRELADLRIAERMGRALVLAPPAPLPVDKTEHHPEKLRATYEIGRRLAEEMLPEIRTFLK